MSYVYLLSDYGEYGSEHVHATLDRNLVTSMVKLILDGYRFTKWGKSATPEQQEERDKELEESRNEYIEQIEKHLLKSDEELASELDGSSFNLGPGWGGMQLHVVKLTK